MPIFAWNISLVSLIFLKSSLLFPIVLFSSISLHWSLRKTFLSLLDTLWNFAFRWVNFSFSPLLLHLFFSHLFVRLPQTIILPFCISFSWWWFWSVPPVQCYEPPSIVLQELCLSNLISSIYFSLQLHNRKGFDLGQILFRYKYQELRAATNIQGQEGWQWGDTSRPW